MTIQNAISKIKEMGFTATLWEKAGKTRIYVSFNSKGMKKEAGFIGSDKTEFVKFEWPRSMSETTGVFMTDKNNKLAEIAKFEIEWNEKKPQPKQFGFLSMGQINYLANKEREEELESWRNSHDL